MQTQNNKLDFSGQTIYIGLDVHKKQITATVLGEHLHYKTFTQPPEVDILTKYLNKNFPGARFVTAYEAGYCGFWLHEALIKKGIECQVVNAADVPTKDKERKQKRDPMDSRKIARSLRAGELEGIYVPSTGCQQDRSLVRTRHRIVGNLTRCKNRIKALLQFFGIYFPKEFTSSGTHWSHRFMEWLKNLELGESGNHALGLLIEEAEFQRGLLTKTTHLIRSLSQEKNYCQRVKLLMTVPGIGLLTAMMILTELEDIARFKSLDKLCAYVGLIPNVSSSGEKEFVGDLTNRGNKLLRSQFIESSWVAARSDPALALKYNQLCVRMKGNKAIVRIARKLLSRVRFVLTHEKEYKLAVVA